MHIIKTPEEDAALESAVNMWGLEDQIGMVLEEIGEFFSVLNKHRRGRSSAEEVAEEIADVIIMMCQMAKAFGGDYYVQAQINAKMQRLIATISRINQKAS